MESKYCFIANIVMYTILCDFYLFRLGHGDIEDEQKSIPLRVETFLMLK